MAGLIPGQYQDNIKYDVLLKANLSEEQKHHAYKLMGFVYIDDDNYSRDHNVSSHKLIALMTLGYVENYKQVEVLY